MPAGTFTRLAQVWGHPGTMVMQKRTAGDGVLSMSFSSLLASAGDDVSDAAGTSFQVRAPVAANRKTHVVAELHGKVSISGEGKCRVTLSGVNSTTSKSMSKTGDFSARLKVNVAPASTMLILQASLSCGRQSSGIAEGMLESLDLVWAGTEK